MTIYIFHYKQQKTQKADVPKCTKLILKWILSKEYLKLEAELKYIEINGCCFNIEEKIKLTFAIEELKNDLGLTRIWLIGKVTGKYNI